MQSAAAQAIGRERILVVEDDDALRDYSSDILKELGYHVTQASNAAEALKAIETGTFDLLFTDVVMPGGMNGRPARRRGGPAAAWSQSAIPPPVIPGTRSSTRAGSTPASR